MYAFVNGWLLARVHECIISELVDHVACLDGRTCVCMHVYAMYCLVLHCTPVRRPRALAVPRPKWHAISCPRIPPSLMCVWRRGVFGVFDSAVAAFLLVVAVQRLGGQTLPSGIFRCAFMAGLPVHGGRFAPSAPRKPPGWWPWRPICHQALVWRGMQ